MRVCLDTSAYSALKRGHPEIVEILEQAEEVVVNPVVLGELLSGCRRGTRPAENQRDLEAFLQAPGVRVEDITEDSSMRYSEILTYLRHQGIPIPINDVWIAATAMQFGLEILTTDQHFGRVPQVVARVVALT